MLGQVVSIVAMWLSLCAGSDLHFTTSPDTITVGLTRSLFMRCSLSDTPVVSGSSTIIGKRYVKQTIENMQYVSSIVVMRGDDHHVAAITQQDNTAKVNMDKGLLTASGDLTRKNGADPYLELTWQMPTINQSNQYVCEINAVDSQGHNVVFRTHLEVGNHEPSFGELVDHIHKLEDVNETNQATLTKLQNDVIALQMTVSKLLPPHVEHGTGSCGRSDRWVNDPNGGASKHSYVRYNFSQKFKDAPAFTLGATFLDHTEDTNTRFSLKILSLDASGFIVDCVTWGDSVLFGLGFSWMAAED